MAVGVAAVRHAHTGTGWPVLRHNAFPQFLQKEKLRNTFLEIP
jgi:hypothetical protein